MANELTITKAGGVTVGISGLLAGGSIVASHAYDFHDGTTPARVALQAVLPAVGAIIAGWGATKAIRWMSWLAIGIAAWVVLTATARLAFSWPIDPTTLRWWNQDLWGAGAWCAGLTGLVLLSVARSRKHRR